MVRLHCFFHLMLSMTLLLFGPLHAAPFAEQNNTLAIGLLKELVKDERDVLISPPAIHSSLLSLYMGSSQLNEYEMRQSLNLNQPQESLPLAYSIYRDNLLSGPLKVALQTTKTLWLHEPSRLNENSLQVMRTAFAFDVESCDLSHPENSITKIEESIQQKTRKKFTGYFDEEKLSPTTQAVLTETASIKSLWITPFKLKDSRQDFFYPHAKLKDPVDQSYMVQTLECDYFENKKCQMICLPLENQLQMLFILPKDLSLEESVAHFEDLFVKKSILSKTTKRWVRAQIPKFQISKRTLLNRPLMVQGFVRAFNRNADFTKLSPNDHFYIANMWHHAQFKLNEWGIDGHSSLFALSDHNTPPDTSTIAEFIANKPFLYLILDTKQDIIVFLGAYVEGTSP